MSIMHVAWIMHTLVLVRLSLEQVDFLLHLSLNPPEKSENLKNDIFFDSFSSASSVLRLGSSYRASGVIVNHEIILVKLLMENCAI